MLGAIQKFFTRKPYPKTIELQSGRGTVSLNAESFWKMVIDCLGEFHGVEEAKAKKLIRSVYEPSDTLMIPRERRDAVETLIYHNEPFYLACDLAQNELDVREYGEAYDKIYERHKW